MAIFREYNPIEHDRAIEDKRRHKQLVEDSIKKNLADILSEESIIGENNNKKIKIPVKGLKEYQFIYGKNAKGVGSGEGEEKRGDKIGTEKEKGKGGAGNDDGEDIYETEISVEEIVKYVFDELDLPNLDKRKHSEVISENSTKKSGYQRNGIRPRLSKKRTVIEKLKRKQGVKRALRELSEKSNIERFPFKQDDLRYFRIKKTKKKEFNAVVICIMDTSGSMDQTKKYMARSFYFLLYQFVKMKYSNVEVAFIAHSTVAKMVSEQEFFHKVESGGTYISSGYKKAMELIEKKYNPEAWNIYAFHVSDGDNWSEDDDRAVEYAKKLCELSNLFGYTEILPTTRFSNIKRRYKSEISNKNFVMTTIEKKDDLWNALKDILKKRDVER